MTNQTAEIARLRGERKVLADLLRDAWNVIVTIELSNVADATALEKLAEQIRSALNSID